MIRSVSHILLEVADVDRAVAFYVEKLAFRVRVDETLPNGMRWATVVAPEQPDVEIALCAAVQRPRAVSVQGSELPILTFRSDDCRRTLAELAARGVTITREAREEPYGTEGFFVDPDGNLFSVVD